MKADPALEERDGEKIENQSQDSDTPYKLLILLPSFVTIELDAPLHPNLF